MPTKVNADKPPAVALPLAGLGLIIANERGGVRKTSTAICILDHLIHRGIPVQVAQIDRQGRLAAVFPDLRVITVDLPSAEDIKNSDKADGEAIDPIHKMLLGLRNGAVAVVDVGANCDDRFCDMAGSTDLDDELKKLGIGVVVLIPMTPNDDAIKCGVHTARRFEAVFTGVRVVPVLCQDGGRFDRFASAETRALFDEQFGQNMRTRDSLEHPRLFSTALAALECAGMSPSRFINLEIAELERITQEVGTVARQIRGEVSKYRGYFRAELNRVLPCRGD